jgi:hypothetical protein
VKSCWNGVKSCWNGVKSCWNGVRFYCDGVESFVGIKRLYHCLIGNESKYNNLI